MPVVKVILDRRFDTQLDDAAESLIEAISDEVMSRLTVPRDKCQVILQPGAILSPPYTIYADVQYRAKADRTPQQCETVLRRISEILMSAFDADVRLRGFAIDQATLSAIDSSRPHVRETAK